jgi:hypothetical protein
MQIQPSRYPHPRRISGLHSFTDFTSLAFVLLKVSLKQSNTHGSLGNIKPAHLDHRPQPGGTMKMRKHAAIGLKGLTLAIALSMAPPATLWADSATTAAQTPTSMVAVQSAYGHLPLSFEANHGQWDPSVQFVTRGSGHQLFLRPTDAVLALRTGEAKSEGRGGDIHQDQLSSSPPPTSQSMVRMRFAGANPQAEMVGLDKLPGIVNYLLGEDPTKWRTNIPTYQKIEYTDVYPGIDLVYYGNQGQLEYDLVVAPGADPKQIRLAFEGVETIDVDSQGDLLLTVPQSSTDTMGATATLRMHKPVVYQRDAHGHKHLLAGTYVLLASQASPHRPIPAGRHPSDTTHVVFQVASYNASQPLIIDPVLSWATYLGGSGLDDGFAIAVDQEGQAYVTGRTFTPGSGFPGTASSLIQSMFSGGTQSDAFVTKINAAGTALIYSTYLGGIGGDEGRGIAVDQAGQAYVTGETSTPGSGFPGTAGSLIQSTHGGGSADAFVAKLNAAGTALVYSTYLGGDDNDLGYGIAVDQVGQAYVTGATSTPGSGFPGTAGSLIQSTFAFDRDAFVAKLNAAGTAIIYATYLGGSGHDQGNGIAVDQAGQAYVTGETSTPGSGFPGTAGSLIQSTHGGNIDVFVAKLNAGGTALVYATYLGSVGTDYGRGIAVDQAGQAYVTGQTTASFPGTAGSLIQSTHYAFNDAFVTKLNAAGTGLVYSTYLGGNGEDDGRGIAVDEVGNAYVTGFTTTPGSGFTGTTGSTLQSTFGGNADAFVTKLNAAGTALIYSTYLGGGRAEEGRGIAVDQAGNAYVTGSIGGDNTTSEFDFPGTADSLIQSTFGGGSDVIVAKISDPPTNQPPVCSAALANPASLWTPNHQFVPVVVAGVTDPESDAVTITVSGVTQDEPVNAKGDGNTSPDAVIQAGVASVRAERSGKGNGRVYQVSFKAEDGKGGSCTGKVTVSVPHSMGKGITAIDDGQVYDSTIQ